jgi:hypothetical protein
MIASCIAETDRDEVFVAKMAQGELMAARRLNNSIFGAAFSMIASIKKSDTHSVHR